MEAAHLTHWATILDGRELENARLRSPALQ